MTCQFGLGKAGMNLLVAYVVQQDGRSAPATLQARNQVVLTLRNIRRDRAQAQRTDRVAVFGHACFACASLALVPKVPGNKGWRGPDFRQGTQGTWTWQLQARKRWMRW
jgi:hypothetical protein